MSTFTIEWGSYPAMTLEAADPDEALDKYLRAVMPPGFFDPFQVETPSGAQTFRRTVDEDVGGGVTDA